MRWIQHEQDLWIDPSRWVYLWGCGDAQDLWFVSDRVDYHSSPAIRAAGEEALRMAGLVSVRRDGRSMIYTARFETMDALLGYLTDNCCGGQPDKCLPRSKTRKRECV